MVGARGLAKSYRVGEVVIYALRGVDLDIRRGELIVLLSPSGSGKSTLLNLLGGLDTPTSGRVWFLGHGLSRATEPELTRFRREHIGFVLQSYNLIPSLTARENVVLVTDIAERPADPAEALALVGLAHRMDHASLGTGRSLVESRAAYYEASRFADVLATLERAPQPLAERIALIPGVAEVETRIVEDVRLDVPGYDAPAVGRLVSLHGGGTSRLNRLHLRRGRTIDARRRDEVVLSEGFADAHGLRPGSRLAAILNGRREVLRVVGVALSPEYVLPIQGGAPLSDDRGFGVLWMGRETLAAAFDMEGAFDDVVLKLAPGAPAARVIERLDRLLELYGGLGAYGRDEQTSASHGITSRWRESWDIDPDARLRLLLDSDLRRISPAGSRIRLPRQLAELLRVGLGDEVLVDVREGERPRRWMTVTRLVDDLLGLAAYVDLASLHRLMGEGGTVDAAALRIAGGRLPAVRARLQQLGGVATVAVTRAWLEVFRQTTARFVLFFTAILTLFAVVIAGGVDYNAARIALEERSWELATLRVLGFTRAEVSTLLLAELTVNVLVALPLGLVLGYAAALGVSLAFETEMFRIPVVIAPST